MLPISKYLARHLVFAVVLALSASGVACQAKTDSVAEIEKLEQRIHTEGARAVVNQLYQQPQNWDYVRKSIASGNTRWLGAGIALYNEADAGAKNMLAASLGEALESSAQELLRFAAHGKLSVNIFCAAPDIDDDRYGTYEKAMSTIDKRITAINSVTNPALAQYKLACVSSLSESKAPLAKFFDK